MKKITIDVEESIAYMEDSKYKANSSMYAKGCNDVLDYFIRKRKEVSGENK